MNHEPAAQPHVQSKLDGPITLLNASVRFYKDHFKVLVIPVVIPIASSIIVQAVNWSSHSMPLWSRLVVIVVSCAAIVVQVLSILTVFILIVECASGSYSGIWPAYKKSIRLALPYVWLGVLSGLAFLGAGVLFFIPAIILWGYIVFSQFALVCDDVRGRRAIITSWYYVKNFWWAVVGRIFFILATGILSAIAAFIVATCLALILVFMEPRFAAHAYTIGKIFGTIIGAAAGIFVFPVIPIFIFSVYKQLKETKPAPVFENEKSRMRSITGLSIWGAIVIILIVACFIAFPVASLPKGAAIEDSGSTIVTVPNETYVNDAGAFEIVFPTEWVVAEDTTTKGVVRVNASSRDDYSSIQVQSTELTSREMLFTDKALADTVIKGIRRVLPEGITYTPSSMEGTTIGTSTEAYLVKGDVISPNTHMKLDMYLVRKGAPFYTISFFYDEADVLKAASLISTTLESFRILR